MTMNSAETGKKSEGRSVSPAFGPHFAGRLKALAALAAIGLLQSCSMTGNALTDSFVTASGKPTPPPVATTVAADFAVAYLPAIAGPIQTVRQVASGTYLQQVIVHANVTQVGGENYLKVEYGDPDYDSSFRKAPSSRLIAMELHREFPRMTLHVANRIGDNAEGGYGYATAALPGGGACIYGWQVTREGQGGDTFKTYDAKARPAKIRLRFCHPSLDETRIAALMDGLRVKPVTPHMMELLAFAGGSGAVAQPLQPAAVAVVPVVPRKVARADSPRKAVQPVMQPAPEAYRPAFPAGVAVPLPNGQTPRVGNETTASIGDRLSSMVAAVSVPLPQWMKWNEQ